MHRATQVWATAARLSSQSSFTMSAAVGWLPTKPDATSDRTSLCPSGAACFCCEVRSAVAEAAASVQRTEQSSVFIRVPPDGTQRLRERSSRSRGIRVIAVTFSARSSLLQHLVVPVADRIRLDQPFEDE